MRVTASVLLGTMILRSVSVLAFRGVPARRLMPRWAITASCSPSPSLASSRHQQNVVHRIYHHGHISSLSSTKAPTVEVSPSDHGTTPLLDFAASNSTLLDNRLLKILQSPTMNISTPTPIQSHAMPLLLNKYDVMASSATGSGKTLMFGLPLLESLLSNKSNKPNANMGMPTALVIAPTRELAVQTAGVLDGFGKGNANLRSRINVCLGEKIICIIDS